MALRVDAAQVLDALYGLRVYTAVWRIINRKRRRATMLQLRALRTGSTMWPRCSHRPITASTGKAQWSPNMKSTTCGIHNSSENCKPISQEQKNFLEAALRVNHAGELAATLIYTAQTPPIVASHPHLRPLMKHMFDQEAGHFQQFNTLLAKHRVRPTAMYPIWHVAATALGWSTGVLGREAAMACTEAVETEIGEHYNSQVRELIGWFKEMEKNGENPSEELRVLVDSIRKIRDEELEHLDHAVENDAKAANPYELLTGVIRAGCKGAIWVSERI